MASYVRAGPNPLALHGLARVQFTPQFQDWVFPLLFLGFAVLAGLWPFHTWAPTGHVAAPTAGSMLLAGVVMKLGAYGCLRVALTLFPKGLDTWTIQPCGPAVVSGLMSHSVIENLQRSEERRVGKE